MTQEILDRCVDIIIAYWPIFNVSIEYSAYNQQIKQELSKRGFSV